MCNQYLPMLFWGLIVGILGAFKMSAQTNVIYDAQAIRAWEKSDDRKKILNGNGEEIRSNPLWQKVEGFIAKPLGTNASISILEVQALKKMIEKKQDTLGSVSEKSVSIKSQGKKKRKPPQAQSITKL